MDVIRLVDAVHVHLKLVVTPFCGCELHLHVGVVRKVGNGENEQQDDDGCDGIALNAADGFTIGENCRIYTEQDDCPQGAEEAENKPLECASHEAEQFGVR